MKEKRGGAHGDKKEIASPAAIFVLSDGIKGHENQSLGIASWLSGSDVPVEVLRVPLTRGLSRFWRHKVSSRWLPSGSVETCRRWLEKNGGSGLIENVIKLMHKSGTPPEKTLFLSAGSSAAPYCLALARFMKAGCCTVMTPSVLGTDPFDFAVVPSHDKPKGSENVYVTLGAPNMIRPQLLEEERERLTRRFPPLRQKRWGILVGGDDKNYHIGPEWVDLFMKKILKAASEAGADLYVTTSRRTLTETEEALHKAAGGESAVRMLLLASKDEWNPVPGMLGLCNRILCTEDSVSMISEAATAGHRPVVLRVDRKKSLPACFGKLVFFLSSIGFVGENHLVGAPKFEMMIKSFEERGLCLYLEDMESLKEALADDGSRTDGDFNEARRAAEWITERWNQ